MTAEELEAWTGFARAAVSGLTPASAAICSEWMSSPGDSSAGDVADHMLEQWRARRDAPDVEPEPMPPDGICGYCSEVNQHAADCSGVRAGYFRRKRA
jgi:hypothetical protein